jgi:hypothetical protein
MSSLYPATEKTWQELRNSIAEDMRERAKRARVNLLYALRIELSHIPEAYTLLNKYLEKHNT